MTYIAENVQSIPNDASLSAQWAIDASHVAKKYGDLVALNDITLQVKTGATLALIGPNGAGKSSFIEILIGLRKATSGQVTVLGNDVNVNPRGHVERLGIQLQETKLFPRVTPREYLRLFSRLFTKTLPIEDVAGRLEITPFLDRRIGQLSGGQRQRVTLALAIINDPDLLILDEPTVGLDPLARHEFWTFLKKLKVEGKTLLFSTHYMEEAKELSTEIAMIANGKLVAYGTADSIISSVSDAGASTLDQAYQIKAKEALLEQII